jgi:hypothetical protein
MKIGVLALPFLLAFPAVCSASQPKFYTDYGEFSLSPTLTLTVSSDEESHMPDFMLKEAAGGGYGRPMAVAKAGDPFLLYWDDATKTLWWATSVRFGYCRLENAHSATSSAHSRSEPLHDYDMFPAQPADFVAEMNQTLPVQ